MTDSLPGKLTSSNNQMVKERNRAAAERTMTAWIQNCFALFSIGITVEEVWLARQRLYPDLPVLLSKEVVSSLALGFVGFGILLLMAAIFQHQLEVRSIERDDYFSSPSRPLNLAVSMSIVVFGVLGMVAITLR